ncbi:MAG: glutamate-5-semialdehyde dehydrogenase [Synechococcus sp. MIT S9220]|uniref:glutamate-5-semialdehyde dehydrogenase n=1 Tax=unclassified Synechococcus TaxID=2626047 RepID=UPI00164B0534|nr:glutamate-5-semialdehyde dehydrogenase [Synechococcus sp. MIT S9220]NOL46504.1 glutamate-5-semialdehyde dehydrogenase [Synechococcus sp. MIT S9220]
MLPVQAVPDPSPELLSLAAGLRRAATDLGLTSDDQRREALLAMAESLRANTGAIVAANQVDLENAEQNGLASALMARLKLDDVKLEGAIAGVRQLAELADPLGRRQLHRELDDGLVLERVSVPLGVVGVIFEARPDAVIQIASLAIRSGNGAILKGGREAECTNKAVMAALQQGLVATSVSSEALALLTTREDSLALLRLEGLVDLIIPRGSNELVRFIQDNTRIPVLGHADGVCHLYVDAEADPDQAVAIALDSKVQYPAACNAMETLLVHADIAEIFLEKAIPAFQAEGVRLLGDPGACSLGISEAAADADWSTEYLALTLSVRVVDDLAAALEHIRRYGSRHTEAIATRNVSTAERFLRSVDSAGVYHNCSTRFADGFRYGFGAEVGISTQTLPPRGPVGLEGLVTYRYRLRGDGHTAADYASGARRFSHVDLEG